mmetsp:Transcript_95598/g.274376  ORF Transcript_95598/g.274376 Transcript_95598/m.274376 type:complete len:541 (+) Transcript_95598:210-1832(+)
MHSWLFLLAPAAVVAVSIHKDVVPHLQLDLGSLSLVDHAWDSEWEASTSGAGGRTGLWLVSIDLPPEQGGEVACVTCHPKLFEEWVRTSFMGRGAPVAGPTKPAVAGQASKHPNAPEYWKWRNNQSGAGGSFLHRKSSRPASAHPALDEQRVLPPPDPQGRKMDMANLSVKVQSMELAELKAMAPRLQKMWSERRLVLGPGRNPLLEQMDFVEAVVHFARASPAGWLEDCGTSIRNCTQNVGPQRSFTSNEALWKELEKSFGAKFLEEHRFNGLWSAAEQRSHAKAMLAAIKDVYIFYGGHCLASQPSGPIADTCVAEGKSVSVGRLACRPEEDSTDHGCVFAELRSCTSKDCDPFFEYARLQAPIPLLQTRTERSQVLGRCEEFSRLSHALFASLGYGVRYILDFTDHVWIEVRLKSTSDERQQTWVHADPSENVLDQPLMYETGWGKKLTMIFAVSPWQVEHVTARYTADYEATVERRRFSDETMANALNAVNTRLRTDQHEPRSGGSPHMLSRERSLSELALWGFLDGTDTSADVDV